MSDDDRVGTCILSQSSLTKSELATDVLVGLKHYFGCFNDGFDFGPDLETHLLGALFGDHTLDHVIADLGVGGESES